MRADIHDGPEQMLQSKAGYIDARPLTASSAKPLATHGRTIHEGPTEKYSERSAVGTVITDRPPLAFPMRTGGCCQTVDREISRFPRKERLHMPGSLTTPGRPNARDDAPRRVAFRHLHGVGTQNRNLSRLNGWPMRPPVNASPKPSRATAHDSGPMWIATPSS